MTILPILKRHIPLILFHIIFLSIVVVTIQPGRQFIGWDGLYPQFDFGLNLSRAFFATWQENYGVGTTTGHGFAGTLPHTIFTFLLSLFLPDTLIRIVFTLFCLYIGGLGMYILLKKLLSLLNKEGHDHMVSLIPYIALAGALFYMLNLGTVQIFYVQLETFISHYATLPWLYFAVILLLRKWNRKNLIIFFAITILSSLQGFIPSLFAAYFLSLLLFLSIYCIALRGKSHAIKRALSLLGLTLICNSFWLTPLVFFQFYSGDTFLNSYNNISSTQHFIDVNKKYGGILDIALLRGYLFDSYQLGDYILRPWIDHYNRVLPSLIGYVFFATIIFGFFYALIKRKDAILLGLCVVAFFFFASIATDMPPFSTFVSLLQQLSPTYAQAFRTAFTKFSIGTSFSYSIFFAVGLFGILHLFLKSPVRRLLPVVSVVIALSLIAYAFPIFQGNLVYDKLLVQMPKPYEEVMEYFETQGDGRIAEFPQDCADGWYAYKWGYFGSGFYWYGVKQPFLSRSFDVWSTANEDYYWEVIKALREENTTDLDSIFAKYDVRWILYDPNVFYCRNQKSFISQEALIKHLESSPNYTLKKTFSDNTTQPILLFERKNAPKTSYVSLKKGLQNIGPSYDYSGTDSAFSSVGTYYTDDNAPFAAYFPFRPFFTNRDTNESAFTVKTTDDSVILATQLPIGLEGNTLSLPQVDAAKDGIPVQISTTQQNGIVTVIAEFQTLQVLLDEIPLTPPNQEVSLGSFRSINEPNAKFFINGELIQANGGVFRGVFYPTLSNTVEIFSSRNEPLFSWNSSKVALPFSTTVASLKLPSYTMGLLSVEVPQIPSVPSYFAERSDNLDQLTPQSCNEITPSPLHKFEADITAQQKYVRLSSTNGSQCLVLYFPKLLTSLGYLMEITARNVSGNPLKVTVYNSNDIAYNEEYLLPSKKLTATYHILPPTISGGVGYSVQLNNASENNNASINDFAGIRLWHIPYVFLTDMTIASSDYHSVAQQTLPIGVDHPNPTGYTVKLPKEDLENTTLILSQSFHPGWKAYELTNSDNAILNQAQTLFPFLFGKELSQHVLINNWANGWILPEDEEGKIVIVFLPQYAQFMAIAITILILAIVLIRTRRTSPHEQSPL